MKSRSAIFHVFISFPNIPFLLISNLIDLIPVWLESVLSIILTLLCLLTLFVWVSHIVYTRWWRYRARLRRMWLPPQSDGVFFRCPFSLVCWQWCSGFAFSLSSLQLLRHQSCHLEVPKYYCCIAYVPLQFCQCLLIYFEALSTYVFNYEYYW